MTVPAYSAQGTLDKRNGFYVLRTERKTIVVAAPNMPLNQMRQLDTCVQMRCELIVRGRLLMFQNDVGFDRGRPLTLTLVDDQQRYARYVSDPIEEIARRDAQQSVRRAVHRRSK